MAQSRPRPEFATRVFRLPDLQPTTSLQNTRNAVSSASIREQLFLSDTQSTYDYVIIGAGTAGCLLAKKLSEDQNCSLLVLDIGSEDPTINTNDPREGWNLYLDPTYCQPYTSLKQDIVNYNGKQGDVTTVFSSGGMPGGCSSISWMLMARGGTSQWNSFTAWTRDVSWEYENLVPLFQDFEGYTGLSQRMYERGSMGKFAIRQSDTSKCTIVPKILDVLINITGEPEVVDYNVSDSDTCVCRNVQWFQKVESSCEASRVNSYNAFLSPLPKNVFLSCKSRVQRVLFESNVATGIQYWKDGKLKQVTAKRKIILCAGVVSALLLMQSGIGSFEVLKNSGYPLVYENSYVGCNLQNHVGIQMFIGTENVEMMKTCLPPFMSEYDFGNFMISFLPPQPNTSNTTIRRWMLIANGSGFYVPDSTSRLLNLRKGKYIHLMMYDLSPSSRGKLLPGNVPTIQHNLYSSTDDQENAVAMYNFMYRLYQQMQENERFELIWPNQDAFTISPPDVLLQCALALPLVSQDWCGTCRMAPLGDDPLQQQGVVDSKLHVYGVKNLMVSDVSIFPTILAGPLIEPALLVAEKAYQICKN